jgi:hypothetical protein
MITNILSISIFLGLAISNARALVGGHSDRGVYLNASTVVSLRTEDGFTYCTGAILGNSPVTVITAAHCVEDIDHPEEIIVNGHRVNQVIPGRASSPGLDLAILIMGPDYVRSPLDEKFVLPERHERLSSYTGPVEMCGYGAEIPQVEMCQPTGRSLKCGEGLYLGVLSEFEMSHRLFTSQIMQCHNLASQEDLASLGVNNSETFIGDSGGPLFLEGRGPKTLIGVLREIHHAKNGLPELWNKACDIEHGRTVEMRWTSVTGTNPDARMFLGVAKYKFGADITGL